MKNDQYMEALLGKNIDELRTVCVKFGLRSFVADQIADWLYNKRVRTIDDMTNLSKAARSALSESFEVGRTGYCDLISSSDGTKKYLFPFGHGVEAVMIPDGDRHTVCVSSQKGCRMGCRFCMTGRQGWHGNLTIGVTLDPRSGESPLRRFMDECSCHLAVSLHNPFPEERVELMPMEKPFPLAKTLSLIREYDFTGQRRVSFEYIMFAGVNDDKRHADALAGMLRGLECRVNLIRFHRIPDSPLAPSPMPVIEQFKTRLNNAGILTTLRASRGEDILAACGMLSGKGQGKQ